METAVIEFTNQDSGHGFLGRTSPESWARLLNGVYDAVYTVDLNRHITFWNQGAEAVTGYQASESIGRGCFDNLLCHVDDSGQELCHRQCPLASCLENGKAQSTRLFLKQKHGARLPVNIRIFPLMADDGSIFGAVQIFSDDSVKVTALEKALESSRLANHDDLTGLGNLRLARQSLAAARRIVQRGEGSVGLLFSDVDFFKCVNDTYGHQAGDAVLKMVAQSMRNCLRKDDIAARVGGEEFAAILPGTNEEECALIARRVLSVCRSARLMWEGHCLQVTLSIGATMLRQGESAQDSMARADSALYRSKREGRNRITWT